MILTAIVLAALQAPGARAPAPVQWEYGYLDVQNSVPFIWRAGDSVMVIDSAFVYIMRDVNAQIDAMSSSANPSSGTDAKQSGPPSAAPMVSREQSPIIRFLNRLGSAGWEMVAVTEQKVGRTGSTSTYLFKRRRT